MPELTRAAYAAEASVSKAAITKAIACGHVLVSPSGKIDTENPKNAVYLVRHKKAAPPPTDPPSSSPAPPPKPEKKKAPPKKQITRGPPPSSSEHKPAPPPGDTVSPPDPAAEAKVKEAAEHLRDLGEKALGLDTEKKKADIALKRSQTRRHDIYVAERKKDLIPRDLVRQDYAAFDAALKTCLKDLPRRISAQLHAIALAEGPRELESCLEREISAAYERAHQAADERGLT